MAAAENNLVVMGHISGLHGVRGWVKVFSSTRPTEAIFRYPNWLLAPPGTGIDATGWQPYQVLEHGGAGFKLMARLQGLDDRDLAASLVGWQIAVEREQLPEPAEGEWYWADLIGMQVVGESGQALGSVVKVLPTGANDVLVLESDQGERLLPFVQGDVITSISAQERVIRTSWDVDWF